MSRAPNQDAGAGLLFLLLGAAFAWGARGYAVGHAAAPGPGFLPLGLALALMAIGALLLATGLRRRPGAAAPARPAWRALAAVLAAVLLFALALPRLGLVVALPLLVGVLALARPGARGREVVLTALVLTLGCGLVFIQGLGVPMRWWG